MRVLCLKPRFAFRRPCYSRPRVYSCASDASDAARRSRETKPGRARPYDDPKRRRGRPAYKRSSFDSPLRDGNRDRLIGLLTRRSIRLSTKHDATALLYRSAVTLSYYLMETNVNVHHWLLKYMKDHPIPMVGRTDVSTLPTENGICAERFVGRCIGGDFFEGAARRRDSIDEME